MSVSLIVAAAKNDVIGKQGGLPWNLPKEMAYFKKTTMGHPIIMGRKTHESIGRALAGRQNIIITRDKDYGAEGCTIVHSLEDALKAADSDNQEVFIIGGESIYKTALPLTDKIYLTRVYADMPGDRYFKFDPSGWGQEFSEKHTADQDNPYDYEFIVLSRG